MKHFLILVCLLPRLALAGMAKEASVVGIITKFDANNVTLAASGGKDVVVPRSSIPAYYSVHTGYKVTAYVSSDTILKQAKK